MRKAIDIAIKDLRVYFSDRGNLVGLLLLPLIFTLVLGFAFSDGGGGGPVRLRMDLIDQDGSEASARLIQRLRETNDTLYFCPQDADVDGLSCGLDDDTLTEEQARQRVREGDTRALLVIPAGFADQLEALQPITLGYYSTSDLASGADPILETVEAVVQEVNAAVIAARVGVHVADGLAPEGEQTIFSDEADRRDFQQAVFQRAQGYMAANPVSVNYQLTRPVEQETTSTPTNAGFGQSIPGMGSMFVLFTVLTGLLLLLRERRQWTQQRLAVMPVRRTQMLGGKILAYFTLGMIQYAVVFALGMILQVDLGDSPLALLLTMTAYVLAVTALTFALATRVETEGQANGLQTLLGLSLAAIGGAWWSLDLPFIPDFMRIIGHISPVAWAMDAFNAVIFYGGGLADVLLPVGVLLLMAAVLFAIGIAGFRYT